MFISELIGGLAEIMGRSGDMEVYAGDMRLIQLEDIDVYTPLAVEDYETYGKRYLHIGAR